jgi:putative transposase
MLDDPADYAWSGDGANALGQDSTLLLPHPLYLTLGAYDSARRDSDRPLFAAEIDARNLEQLRACLQTGTPLGNDWLREQSEQSLNVRVGYSS